MLGTQASPPTHVGWVDTAKGLGIIFVVFGHVLRSLVTTNLVEATPVVLYMDAWIYSFHMPLFFFVSGLFLARSAKKAATEFAWDKIGSVAYPYVVWSTITLAIKSLLGEHVNQPRTLLELPDIFTRPIEQFWFLYVLFLTTIIVGMLLKLGMRRWAIVLFAALLYPGLLPLPWSGWIPFDYARLYSVYLALGMAVGTGPFLHKLSELNPKILSAVIVVNFLTVTSLAIFLRVAHPRWLDFILALSGTGAVVALSILVNQLRIDSAISFIGRRSLEIFVAHTIFSAAIRILCQQVLHITTFAPHILLGTLFGLFGPIVLAIAFQRIGLTCAFTLPKKAQFS